MSAQFIKTTKCNSYFTSEIVDQFKNADPNCLETFSRAYTTAMKIDDSKFSETSESTKEKLILKELLELCGVDTKEQSGSELLNTFHKAVNVATDFFQDRKIFKGSYPESLEGFFDKFIETNPLIAKAFLDMRESKYLDETIPIEIADKVLSYLGYDDLVSLARTSIDHYHLTHEHILHELQNTINRVLPDDEAQEIQDDIKNYSINEKILALQEILALIRAESYLIVFKILPADIQEMVLAEAEIEQIDQDNLIPSVKKIQVVIKNADNDLREKLDNIFELTFHKNSTFSFLPKDEKNILIFPTDLVNSLRNLKKLDFYKLEISDINGLSLPYLEKLCLKNSKIKDIENIVCPNLKFLDLSDNNIKNIDALQQLTNLQTLILSDNNIQNIDALQQLTNLQSLLLSDNNIQNIDALQQLTNLQALMLSNNNIENIDALLQLTNLQALFLIGNNIDNIDALLQLPNLQTLYFQ